MTTAKKNIYFSPKKKICNIYVNWLISIRFARNNAKIEIFFFAFSIVKVEKSRLFSFLTPYFPVFNKCKYCCSSSSFNDGGAAASGKGSTGSKCTFWILFHVILHYRVIYVTQTSTPKNYKGKASWNDRGPKGRGRRAFHALFETWCSLFFGNCVKPYVPFFGNFR